MQVIHRFSSPTAPWISHSIFSFRNGHLLPSFNIIYPALKKSSFLSPVKNLPSTRLFKAPVLFLYLSKLFSSILISQLAQHVSVHFDPIHLNFSIYLGIKVLTIIFTPLSFVKLISTIYYITSLKLFL